MNTSKWFSQLVPAMLLLLGIGATAQTYRIVEVATLAPGNAAVVYGPNSAGEGVGGGKRAGSGAGGQKGVLFGAGVVREIGGLSDDTMVYGLNDAGGLVGSSNKDTGLRAFTVTQAGAARDLPPLGGDTSSVAYGIDKHGQAVGFSSGAGLSASTAATMSDTT